MSTPRQPCMWSYSEEYKGLHWWNCEAHKGQEIGELDSPPLWSCDNADTNEEEQQDDEPPYNPRNDPWSPHYDDGTPRGLTPEALADYVAREEAQHLPHRP